MKTESTPEAGTAKQPQIEPPGVEVTRAEYDQLLVLFAERLNIEGSLWELVGKLSHGIVFSEKETLRELHRRLQLAHVDEHRVLVKASFRRMKADQEAFFSHMGHYNAPVAECYYCQSAGLLPLTSESHAAADAPKFIAQAAYLCRVLDSIGKGATSVPCLMSAPIPPPVGCSEQELCLACKVQRQLIFANERSDYFEAEMKRLLAQIHSSAPPAAAEQES